MDATFEHQVRQRAYQIWMDHGQTDGMADDHWFAAERDLRAQPTAAKAKRAPARPKAATKSATTASASKAKAVKATRAKVADASPAV